MQAQKGGRGVAPTHLQPRRKKMGDQHHAAIASSRERHGTYCNGGWKSGAGLKKNCNKNGSFNYVKI
jgi:hypothetical protein